MHLSINKTDLGGIYMYRIFLYSHQSIFTNDNIALYFQKYIDITVQKYREDLIACNVIVEQYPFREEYYFKKYKDAKKAVNLLNEKYLTMIKLMEC